MIIKDPDSSPIVDSQVFDAIAIHNNSGYTSLSQPPPTVRSSWKANLEAASAWESRFEDLVPMFLEGNIDEISISSLARLNGSIDCLTRLPIGALPTRSSYGFTVARIAHSVSQ